MEINNSQIIDFIEKLQTWFSVYGRDFAWRHTNNPYHILIAEKLLQQTAVNKGVEEIYEEFLQRFPDTFSLSKASIDELKTLIYPLGFAYRAKELINLASIVVLNYDKIFPDDLKSLLLLPGIGDYSARAILSFAYNKNIPIVDTNIARILVRVFDITHDYPQNPARSKKLNALAKKMVSSINAKIFNWAMIDFGSTICKSKIPQCAICPVNDQCQFMIHYMEKQC